MRLTTKGRYGVRIMVVLALHYKKSPVTVRYISKGQGISMDYVEQLFIKLKRCGFVRSVRGPKGGFLLAKPPSRLKMMDIMECVGESINLAPCILAEKSDCHGCRLCGACVGRRFFEEVTVKLKKIMESISLSDLCKKGRVI